MSNSPRLSPLATADDGETLAADAVDAAATASSEQRPRAPPTTDLPKTGELPLAAPNPPNPVDLIPPAASPSAALPSSITGLVDFKLALDGSNFYPVAQLPRLALRSVPRGVARSGRR